LTKYSNILCSGMVLPVPKFHIIELFAPLSKPAYSFSPGIRFSYYLHAVIYTSWSRHSTLSIKKLERHHGWFWCSQEMFCPCGSLVLDLPYKASHNSNMLQPVHRNVLFVNNNTVQFHIRYMAILHSHILYFPWFLHCSVFIFKFAAY
jgi:hypothetical protein